MPDENKGDIGLWINKSENKKAPNMTGKATCPCCDAKLRVAVWAREPDGNKPRLSGEIQAAEESAAPVEDSGDLLDEVLEEVGTVEEAEAKAKAIPKAKRKPAATGRVAVSQDDIPF